MLLVRNAAILQAPLTRRFKCRSKIENSPQNLPTGVRLEKIATEVAKNYRPLLSDPRGDSVDFCCWLFELPQDQKEPDFCIGFAWGCVSITPEKAKSCVKIVLFTSFLDARRFQEPDG